MVFCGFYFIGLFLVAFYLSAIRQLDKTWFLKMALYSLPLPWIAAELGWVVAEYGRQPWVVQGILPTFLGSSTLHTSSVILTLIGFVGIPANVNSDSCLS
jgi:cytochrome d ubiquinol oxidase subunit I